MFEKIFGFLTTGIIGFIVYSLMEMGIFFSILGGLLSGLVAIWLYKYLQGDSNKKTGINKYEYRYRRHPFDTYQYFTIEAMHIDEANLKAKEFFSDLRARKVTVSDNFYPVTNIKS